MARLTQKDRNPFPHSDSNKRYYSYDYWLKKTFGGKCAKIPLDAGFTCPNIDGTCGVGGCTYCSGRGSGDFAESPLLPLSEQYRITREKLGHKWSTERCIPYFQAHTNTYAPLPVLREKYEEALSFPNVVGMNIGTRADAIEEDVARYLAELSDRTVLTVELGLQSSNDETARRINRGHDFAAFLEGYSRLRAAGGRIRIGVHIILGLPGEDDEMMLETVKAVARLRPDEVKLHLLHVIKGTALAREYESGEYCPLERERYISLVARSLCLLPPETVIGRLTGDGMQETLLAPMWSTRKTTVLNDIDKYLYENDLWQGKCFQ
ncbi:MAG: TIGR01212 family radical SAM protein [Clostridia bacterium]|nr:TIGR01212 family radical SAM protein [Clostridia bacterium]